MRPKWLQSYSLGAFLFELGLIPCWIFGVGQTYFYLKSIFHCTNITCFKFCLASAVIPSSLICGYMSGLSQKYLFPTGYSIKESPIIIAETANVYKYTKAIGLFITVGSLTFKMLLILNPDSNAAYFIRTLRPRIKNVKRNWAHKVKNKYQKVKEKICSKTK